MKSNRQIAVEPTTSNSKQASKKQTGEFKDYRGKLIFTTR
jgi:hypothetical protein